MFFPLLQTYIIIGISHYENVKNSGNQGGLIGGSIAAATTGYKFSCECTAVSSIGCTQISCSMAAERNGCFPGISQVTLSDGTTKPLADLKINDRVLVDHEQTYEPIIAFIHAKHDDSFTYLAVHIRSTVTNQTSTLFVSRNHLVFDFDTNDAYFAARFRVGQRVQYIDSNELVPGEIISIELTHKTGYYAPLTPSGRIVIDNVVASNYATVSNHNLAHKMMGIYRWWLRLAGEEVTGNEEIPWILQYFIHVAKPIQWIDHLIAMKTFT